MQYMVANVDYTFIVTSLNEDYSYNRIARYVSVVLQGHSIPVVVLTKAGYSVHVISDCVTSYDLKIDG